METHSNSNTKNSENIKQTEKTPAQLEAERIAKAKEDSENFRLVSMFDKQEIDALSPENKIKRANLLTNEKVPLVPSYFFRKEHERRTEITSEINDIKLDGSNAFLLDPNRPEKEIEEIDPFDLEYQLERKRRTRYLIEEPETDIEKIESEKVGGIHAGHKTRLRKKALLNINVLNEHEVLELLLNFGVVRKNTNPLAHYLIDKYGTVADVMDAKFEDLIKEPGVGEISASLLTLIPKIMQIYIENKIRHERTVETISEAVFLFKQLFAPLSNEALYIACFGEGSSLLAIEKVAEGSRTQIDVDIATALKIILKYNPVKVILAHNHVGNSAMPSRADIVYTNALHRILKQMQIELFEHFVICRSEEYACLVGKKIIKPGKNPIEIPKDLL